MKLLKSTASLGGEILGINLSQKLNQEQINFLNQCWDDRLVLVFKKQELDDNKLINFISHRDLIGSVRSSTRLNIILITVICMIIPSIFLFNAFYKF